MAVVSPICSAYLSSHKRGRNDARITAFRAGIAAMTTFDKREEAFEKKYVIDEELKFKAVTRRNKLLGLWAAKKRRQERGGRRRLCQGSDRGRVRGRARRRGRSQGGERPRRRGRHP